MTESPNLADTLTEPADGSRLMLIERDNFVRPIWRDDAGARSQSASEGERWFDDCTDPADWREILRYATKVYAVADKPMTAETPEITRPCRHCGAQLKQLNGHWYSTATPRFFCNGERALDRHEPTTTPECKAVDKILRWDEVQEGDLALIDGVMSQVEKIRPPHEGEGWQSFDFSPGGTRSINDDDLTAVTRYETTKD